MDCNIIKDLLPLYLDDCCSEESRAAVEGHLKECGECKKAFDAMNSAAFQTIEEPYTPKPLSRINDWKASVLQSLLLFFSFIVITVGVALEAATPVGVENSFWAFSLVIPATGFLISLANWYFIRIYPSKAVFSNNSWALTLLVTVIAFLWTCFHYGMLPWDIFFRMIDPNDTFMVFWALGIVFTLLLCVLSKWASQKYAKLLGKE